ncbi:siderophore-interacting protein [Microbacterium sp. 1P10UB]|uniref:siderophore-interacting protein n=1 Tax=unclassified Microbacterium TaxID=2609290 RepID=UPI0039A38472
MTQTSAALSVRPAYRPYLLDVARVERLSPSFVRVTLTGDELEHFGTAGLDQRIKVLFPRADGTISDVGQDDEEAIAAALWYERWRALPTEDRSPFRTYTVRAVRPDARELDIEFVVHHDPGPAGEWAAQAAPGQQLLVVGPDERSPHSGSGIDWRPGPARRLLLAGDETAAPAIQAIVESLGEGYDVDAFIEVPEAADIRPCATPAGVRLTWLPRSGREHGEALRDAVEAWCGSSEGVLRRASSPLPQELDDIDVDRDLLWDSPDPADGEFYAWFAGEAATIKALRRQLVQGCGVDRRRVAFMGYWRRGQAERVE